MKKSVMYMNKQANQFRTILLATFVLVTLFSFSNPSRTTYAQTVDDGSGTMVSPCGGSGPDSLVGAAAGALANVVLGKCPFYTVKMAIAQQLDIRRTIMDSMVTLITDFLSGMVLGYGVNQHQACLAYAIDCINDNRDIRDSLPEEIQDLYPSGNCSPGSGGICSAVLSCPGNVTSANALPSRAYMGSSFAGLTLATTAVSLSEVGPMPSFNLANYGKYLASNTLIVRDTAFAQSFDNFLPGSIGPAITQVWELIRNISYSLLAIFMIYVGAMIMMRKQVSSQVVVTAQYAIPRIIISIILITFSMAIGLLGLGLIIPMQAAIVQPISQATVDATGGMCVGPILLSTVLSGSIFRVGVGLTFIVLSLGINLLTLILWFMVGIKYLFTYVKLIAATVSSPLTFAWGSIPGNEESITNWFKYFLANMLALPAMVLTMEIGKYIITVMIVQSVAQSFGTPTLGASSPWSIVDAMGGYVLGMILGYYMFFMALKMPKMIENALIGEAGGKKKR